MPDQQPTPKVQFTEFMGLTSNVNPHRVEPGSFLEAVNCRSDRAGELVVRPGMREVTFD